ncbi:MAG: AMP-binding protein, partial [Gemmatimonadota bacterium]|nr:AMP-binding protein [Gemmatimonadota bacterium]
MDGGAHCSYAELAGEAMAWRARLAPARPGDRVAYLVPPGRIHVAIQLGIWARGGIAVPLAVSHPLPELEYVLDDARPAVVVADPTLPPTPRLTASAHARGATAVTPTSSAHTTTPSHPATQPTPGPHPPTP